jgi:GPH family glycoside/pentoside/hexuronide:cation symporter
MNAPARKLTLPLQIAYACGQAGNVLSDSLIATFLLVLYQPPGATEAEAQSMSLLPKFEFGAGAAAFAVSGMFLISVLARGIDTFLDPMVANWSDRNTSRIGRRRLFMLIGALPLALATGLAFFPPDHGATNLNFAFLAVVMTTYYAMFSVYVGPYLAMLPEIAPEPALNVRIGTMMAAFALFGALIAINGGGALIAQFGEASIEERQRSIQLAVGCLAVVAFVLLAVPVVVVPEAQLVSRRNNGQASHAGVIESLKKTFSDTAFVPYVIGNTLFAFGFNMVRSALFYFVTVLMLARSDSAAPTAMFAVAAIAFPFVAKGAVRFGKRPVMLFGCVALAASLTGFWFVDGVTIGTIMFACCGLGVSVFLAIPNAMISDIANANAARSGERREAMFFGAQGFLQKVTLGVSTAVLSELLKLGNSTENPLGVQLAGPVAAVALLVAAVCFWRYPERRILDEVAAANARKAA